MSKKNKEKRLQQQEALSEQIAQESKSRLKLVIALLVIIIAPIATYWNSLEGEFHFDDYHAIVENPNVKSFDRAIGLHTRFVTDVSLAIDYSLGKLDTRYYHAQQVFWHIMNCILIFFILRLTLKRLNQQNLFIPFATALLFAVHPLNSEPVNYLIQRSMVLGTFFYLASLLFFILCFNSLTTIPKLLTTAGSLLCFILAILTKETFATLPIALFAYHLYFIKPQGKKLGFKFWAVATAFVILVFGWMSYLGLFKAIAREIVDLDVLLNSLLTQLKVGIEYISLMALPLPSRLNVDHFYHETQFTIMNIVAIVIIGGITILVFRNYRNKRLLSFGLLWLFLTHFPTSLIPRGEVMVEYRNYLPIFGFLSATGYLIYNYLQKFRELLYIITIVITVTLSLFTVERNKVWKDNLTLWKDSLTKTQISPRAITYVITSYAVKGDFNNTIMEGEKALQFPLPSNCLASVYSDLGVAYTNKGDFDRAEQILIRGIGLNTEEKHKAILYGNLGFLYNKKGNYDKAIPYFEMAIKANPIAPEPYINIGTALVKIGKVEQAKANFGKFLELDPLNDDAYLKVAAVFAENEMYDEVIAYLARAVNQSKSSWLIHYNLAAAYERKGNSGLVERELLEAVKYKPDYVEAIFNLGLLYANKKDYEEARVYFNKALSLTSDEGFKNKINNCLYELGKKR